MLGLVIIATGTALATGLGAVPVILLAATIAERGKAEDSALLACGRRCLASRPG